MLKEALTRRQPLIRDSKVRSPSRFFGVAAHDVQRLAQRIANLARLLVQKA
uniref:Uncharacterized protein n=1 Tax=Enterobacter cloacae TaxID=550 RepID=A0A5P1PJJ2_ENTCL|nr:hypothetical protein [Enterobacter cloacae]